MATFNGGMYLSEQIESILNQTYRNFELIISDDCSTDNTIDILKKYSQIDSRIKFSVNPRPNGYKKNFERAITLSLGEIVFLCDQDDVWYPEKIQEHMDCYKDKAIKWVYNEVVLVDYRGNKIGLLTDDNNDYYKEKKLLDYTWGTCILGCATSYRSILLKSVLPIDNFAHGHDSHIQFAIYPSKPFYINKILQKYRRHSSNVSIVNFKGDIDQAIDDNMRYLKSLIFNRGISIIKKLIILNVIFLKRMRFLIKKI